MELKINGKLVKVDVPDDMPVLWVLRDTLGMTGTKYGCGMSLCGACTIHLDGVPVRSCVTTVALAQGKEIRTIEGVDSKVAKAVQEAWVENGVPQCGYCQPGQVMAATALLTENKNPTDQQIDEAFQGNICRCGTYARIRVAVHKAAKSIA